MVTDKMKKIQLKYKELRLKKDEHSAEFEQFIRETIHPEKYITMELVDKMMYSNSEGKELRYTAIKDEDKLLACSIIGVTLNLHYFDSFSNFPFREWFNPSYNEVPFNEYILPIYKSLVYKCIPVLANFNKELAKYNPEITVYRGDKWKITLNISGHECVLNVDNLSKDTLDKVKQHIEDVCKTIIIYNQWKQDVQDFLHNVKSLVNDDDYELSSNRLEIPLDVRRQTGEKRSIRIISSIYATSHLNFDIHDIELSVDLIKGNSIDIIARICDFKSGKIVDGTLVDFVKSGNYLPDLDELFQNIKILVNSNYKNVILLD